MREVFETELYPELPDLIAESDREHGRRRDSYADDLAAMFERIRLVFLKLHTDTEAEAQATAIAETVDAQQAEDFAATMRASLGIEVIAPTGWRAAVQRAFIDQNVDLIRSLSDDALDQARAVIQNGVSTGARVESIRDELEQRLGVAESRAALIARDQTLKLYGEESEARQTAVGIEGYTWNTSHDERVRPRHKDLDGTVQKWSDPPVVDVKTGRRAHPGMDYQCRCIAIPVIPKELLS